MITLLPFFLGCVTPEIVLGQIKDSPPEDTAMDTAETPWFETGFGEDPSSHSSTQACWSLWGSGVQITAFFCTEDAATGLTPAAWVSTTTCDGVAVKLPLALEGTSAMLVVEAAADAQSVCVLQLDGETVRELMLY